MAAVDASTTTAWLHRRAGFGLSAAALEADTTTSPDDALSELVGTIDDQPDPWSGLFEAYDNIGQARRDAVVAWIQRFATTTSPYIDRRSLMLHGWLVSAIDKATPQTMVDQMRLFMTRGGGSYPGLLRAITIDPAMLIYLDGRTSTAAAPNENFGRELLELFALGVGERPDGSEQPYSEDDVKAAAAALTGWAFGRQDDVSRFVPHRHDDTPQRLLGVPGVHDVDTVIDAVVAHEEHPRFVARRIAAEYVGDTNDRRLVGVVDDLVDSYESNDRRLDAVIEDALRLGLEGRSSPIVLAPIPWMTIAARALGVSVADLGNRSRDSIREMGHIPMFPRSVKGWEGGTAWFTASSLIARTNIAADLVAAADPDHRLMRAADVGDWDEVARSMGLSETFGAATATAIRGATNPNAGLVLALVSPEGLVS